MAMRLAVLALMGVIGATPVAAEEARFDLVLKGIKAGSLAWSGGVDGNSYAVSGVLKTSGLAAMLKKVSFSAKVSGAVSNGRFYPSSYAGNSNTGKRQSEAQMVYKAGVPQVVVNNPAREARPYDIDPAGQKGSVDTLTALYATLRDVAPGDECKVSLKLFDGRRASQLVTSSPRADGDKVVCAGEYRRIAGYSPEDMAEKTRFPFTLTYAPVEGGKMRVIEVATDTLYGKARLTRK